MPAVFRARAAARLPGAWQIDGEAMPIAIREFSRTDRSSRPDSGLRSGRGRRQPAFQHLTLPNRAGAVSDVRDPGGRRPRQGRRTTDRTCRSARWRRVSTSSRSRPRRNRARRSNSSASASPADRAGCVSSSCHWRSPRPVALAGRRRQSELPSRSAGEPASPVKSTTTTQVVRIDVMAVRTRSRGLAGSRT